jgi:hypothetical protein
MRVGWGLGVEEEGGVWPTAQLAERLCMATSNTHASDRATNTAPVRTPTPSLDRMSSGMALEASAVWGTAGSIWVPSPHSLYDVTNTATATAEGQGAHPSQALTDDTQWIRERHQQSMGEGVESNSHVRVVDATAARIMRS